MAGSGYVSIVGAGPGAAEHLTLKALQCIEKADVILYDALVGREIRALFPRGVVAIYCGKRCGQHSMSQEEIGQALVRLAQKGKHVIRLKGGDPLVFGRGGEEAIVLRKAGVPFEIVPGLSAMNAIGALAGIPLTHRKVARQVLVMEGHTIARNPDELAKLGSYNGTLVIYMGTRLIQQICLGLLAAGVPESRAIALVESGSQGLASHLQISDLRTVAQTGLSKQTDGPGLIYIGDVVGLLPGLQTPQVAVDCTEVQDDALLAANLS